MDEPIPTALGRELRALHEAREPVARRVEEAVLAAAAERFAARRRRGWRRVGQAASLAAAAALVVALLRPHVLPAPERTETSEPFAADLDGNGRVDVVDALLVARAVERGLGPDLNGDGRLDRADAEFLVGEIVRLDR